MKRRSPKRISDSQLQKLATRLIRSNRSTGDTPVIIAEPPERAPIATGRLLKRDGAWVTVLVDNPVRSRDALRVFLPRNVYLAEAVSCVAQGTTFRVELVLIQHDN